MESNKKVKRQILEEFLKVVRILSDKNYQKRVWIRGSETEVNSYDESVCDFFDLGERIFVDPQSYDITDQQFTSIVKLRDQLDEFSTIHSYEPLFIDTPEWNEITEMAKEVLRVLDCQK